MLRRYFTNLDGPVFALVNLPEVVKGALFARYSRSPKSLRRLFLDEFVNDLDIEGDESIDATIGLARAEELYEKVFFEYGDDSVAQLGGVHLACEQASNLLTKILEWGRLMSYLEQSTRYIAYDARLGGRYRFHRDPDVLASQFGTRYVGDMDRMFDAYSRVGQPGHQPRARHDPSRPRRQRVRLPPGDTRQGARRHPRHAAGGEPVERRDLRQRAGVRVAAAADALAPAARSPALRRPDAARAAQGDPELPAPRRPRRSRRPVESSTSSDTRTSTAALVEQLFGGTPVDLVPEVELVDFDPDAENKLVAAICYSQSHLPESTLIERVQADDRRREDRAGARVRRRPHEPPAQAGPGVRAGRLPVRRAVRLRRLPRPATASHAHDRVADAHAEPRLHAAGSDRRGRCRRAVRRDDGPLGARCSTTCTACSRSRPRTPCRWPTGCGT